MQEKACNNARILCVSSTTKYKPTDALDDV